MESFNGAAACKRRSWFVLSYFYTALPSAPRTITPVRAPALGRAITVPSSIGTVSMLPSHGVTWAQTVPNPSFLEKIWGNSNAPSGASRATSVHSNGKGSAPDSIHVDEKEARV